MTAKLNKWGQPIKCDYCPAVDGLRIEMPGFGSVPAEYICEDCFAGQDDGPCWDDLPEVKS